MPPEPPVPPAIVPTLLPVPDRLVGKRVVVRPLEVSDAPAVFEAMESSRPRLSEWMLWPRTRQRTLEETVDYCARTKAQWMLRDAFFPGVFRSNPGQPDDGRYLGGVGFHPAGRGERIDWTFPALELGYWIRDGEEGKGYVGEAVDLLLGLAFETLGAPRVEARCDSGNARSLRVMERAGFSFEGVLRSDNRWADGTLCDTAVCSILPEEWASRAGRPPNRPVERPSVPPGSRRPAEAGSAPPPRPLPTTIALPERIDGPRVFLRPWTGDDATGLHEAIRESLPRLEPWMPWTKDHAKREGTLDFCLRSAANWVRRTSLILGIFDRATGRVLGGTGLHAPRRSEIDWSGPFLEIGYWIRTGEEGKGYVVEAVRLVAGLAFETLGACRVQIQCDLRNVRSVRVMEAAGFVREAVLRRDERTHLGEVRDTAMYAAVRCQDRSFHDRQSRR
jgi:RimJ/RimL family protein N-acetyltransferase